MHSLTKIHTEDSKLGEFYLYGGNISPEDFLLDEMWRLNIDNVPWQSK